MKTIILTAAAARDLDALAYVLHLRDQRFSQWARDI